MNFKYNFKLLNFGFKNDLKSLHLTSERLPKAVLYCFSQHSGSILHKKKSNSNYFGFPQTWHCVAFFSTLSYTAYKFIASLKEQFFSSVIYKFLWGIHESVLHLFHLNVMAYICRGNRFFSSFPSTGKCKHVVQWDYVKKVLLFFYLKI